MRLDWNLVRTILAHIESETISDFLSDADSCDEWKEGQKLSERKQSEGVRIVLSHVKLLVASRFIENIEVRETNDGVFLYALGANPSLTIDGYSLLESLRTEGFIKKAKAFAKDNSVALTIGTITELTKAMISRLG